MPLPTRGLAGSSRPPGGPSDRGGARPRRPPGRPVRASGVVPRHGHRLGAVGPAEEEGMDDEHVEPVQAHPLAPAVGQRRGLVVAGDDPLQVRLPEHAEGGQIGLGVRPVGERVDEDAHDVAVPRARAGGAARGRPQACPPRRPGEGLPAGRPQDIAGPQVPVGAGDRYPVAALAGRPGHELRLGGVEVAVAQSLADPLEDGDAAGGQRSAVAAGPQIGGEAVVGEELAPPARRRALRLGLAGPDPHVRAAHPGAAVPAGRGDAEGRGAGGVRDGEGASEGLRGGGAHPRRGEAGLLDPALADRRRDDVGAAVGHRLGQPGQALRLEPGRAGAIVLLADRLTAHDSIFPRAVEGRDPRFLRRPGSSPRSALAAEMFSGSGQ